MSRTASATADAGGPLDRRTRRLAVRILAPHWPASHAEPPVGVCKRLSNLHVHPVDYRVRRFGLTQPRTFQTRITGETRAEGRPISPAQRARLEVGLGRADGRGHTGIAHHNVSAHPARAVTICRVEIHSQRVFGNHGFAARAVMHRSEFSAAMRPQTDSLDDSKNTMARRCSAPMIAFPIGSPAQGGCAERWESLWHVRREAPHGNPVRT